MILLPIAVAIIEKSATPEETSLETKAEPEPVYIDEVTHFFINKVIWTQVTSKLNHL